LGEHIKFDKPDKGIEAIHEQGEPIWAVLYLDEVNITAGKMETVIRLNMLLDYWYRDQEERNCHIYMSEQYNIICIDNFTAIGHLQSQGMPMSTKT